MITNKEKAVQWGLATAVFVIIVFIFFITLFIGCSEAKKGQNAVNRVKANINLLTQVGESYRSLFPCSNDTITTTIRDTTTNTLVKVVTKTDTLKQGDTLYIFHTDTAYFEKTKTIYKEKIVTDKELTNRQKDTINSLKVQQGVKDGVIQELRAANSTLKKENNHLKWYLVGSFLLTILSHVVRSYAANWIGSAKKLFTKS